jgi:pimeloyl-ACP methyl ester carboxylesterase
LLSFVPFRISIPTAVATAMMVTVAILSPTIPALCLPVEPVGLHSQSTAASSSIVIGFVGGFVSHNDLRHGPVRLAQRIQRSAPKDTYVAVFENRRRKRAYDTVNRLLDTDHDGTLSTEEKARARIVVFGHSWGAAAAVLLARDLRQEGVPVLLTVQVDSVAKVWQNDSVIPDNVAEAVNFYQPHGILHGRSKITAADPAKTEILGNYRFDYKKYPIVCQDESRVERFFAPGHLQSECDPQLWSVIESMLRERLSSAGPSPTKTTSASTLAIQPQPWSPNLFSRMLSISRVGPTNAATATSPPSVTLSIESRLSGSTISK